MSARPAAGRAGMLRPLQREGRDEPPRTPPPAIFGAVAFEAVSYAYIPGKVALRDVSFRAVPDTMTALVGQSGSGKSTVIRLLLGFDRPASGRVLIDGHDLASLGRRDYRHRLGVLMQESFLFDGTIAANIRCRAPAAPAEAVWLAGRLAQCDEFVRRLPNGYETVVGERGVRLTRGERRRVAIARTLLADPRILLLDEVPRRRDDDGDEQAQAAVRALMEGRTAFVIAQRLSTVQRADQILVLESGAVVERGRHEELLAQGGRYARVYEAQHRRTVR